MEEGKRIDSSLEHSEGFSESKKKKEIGQRKTHGPCCKEK